MNEEKRLGEDSRCFYKKPCINVTHHCIEFVMPVSCNTKYDIVRSCRCSVEDFSNLLFSIVVKVMNIELYVAL